MASSIYQVTSSFPRAERFGIVDQLRRSAVSIPANIAEGCGRIGDRELARFLSISMGSASELEYLLLLSKDIGYLDQTSFDQLTGEVIEIKKMLTSFVKKLKADC